MSRKFELKNVQYLAANSRDSHCFSATLYVDGKRFCLVSDDGWGGETRFEPFSHGKYGQLQSKLREFDAELLQEFGSETHERGDGSTFTMQNEKVEYIVCNLVNDFLLDRDIKRDLSKRVLWQEEGTTGVLQTQCARNKETLNKWIEQVADREEVTEVLNLLPIEKVREIYRTM
jgi:hypothetical protein